MKKTKRIDPAVIQERIKSMATKRGISPRELALQILSEGTKPKPRFEEIAFYADQESQADHILYEDRDGRLYLKIGACAPTSKEAKPIGETEAILDYIDHACDQKWGARLRRRMGYAPKGTSAPVPAPADENPSEEELDSVTFGPTEDGETTIYIDPRTGRYYLHRFPGGALQAVTEMEAILDWMEWGVPYEFRNSLMNALKSSG